MWQHGVHPGHAEDGERDVETAHHQHVPVVGRALHQLVVGAVHHGLRDVLVHEEEEGEGEAQHHARQDDLEVELGRDRKVEDLMDLGLTVSFLY